MEIIAALIPHFYPFSEPKGDKLDGMEEGDFEKSESTYNMELIITCAAGGFLGVVLAIGVIAVRIAKYVS